jgi:thiol-disulfide isomerase/thioredoxin
MFADLLVRAVWALAIAGIFIGLYRVVNWGILTRAKGKRLGLETIQPGVPTILYFTTPTCVPCKTTQRPALVRLQERVGSSIEVIEIDASERSEVADYWGVLSVPTTFIIDSKGRPRRVNHGVASAEKLEMQLKEVEKKPFFRQYFRTAIEKLQGKRNYL